MRSGSSIQLLSKEFYMNITAKPTWQWKNNGAGNHIRDGRTSPHPSLLKQLLLPRSLDVSFALTELDNVTEAPTARMADFARFGIAVKRALSWPKGTFNAAFEQNQQEQMTNSLGDDPLAAAMRALVRTEMEVGTSYANTPMALLQVLSEFLPLARFNSIAWPQSPHSLSKRLKKMEPALRACGIGIAFHHSGNRTISVTRLASFTK
jgi:hypothetical protein